MSLREQYERDGFVVVDSGLSAETMALASKATGPLQPKEYHYNPLGRRVFEGWKDDASGLPWGSRPSDGVRAVAYAPGVVDALEELYPSERLPRAFQTINFDRGTNQPLHQDGVHFQTMPLGLMVGVWVALEDMDEENGSLAYVPFSHRLGYLGWQELGQAKCRVGEQYTMYGQYEARVAALGAECGPTVPLVCPAGKAFIWGLELLHGGWPVVDKQRTRFSQVTHYVLPGVEFGWAPMFSDPAKGEYYKKSGRWFDRNGVVRPW